MHDVLEQVNNFLSEPVEPDDSQEIFDRVVDFIMNLEPDSLSDDQIEKIMDIISDLEPKDELEEQSQAKKTKFKLAQKSPMKKRQHSRKYYRQNRVKIKKKKVIFKRSIEGRVRKRLKKRMETRRLSPTGRKKVRYHPTRGGQGGKRKKENEKK
jgi:hypothetical protein